MESIKIRDYVRDTLEPVINQMNYELVGAEYLKEGANWFLRLYIDKEKGVDLDDCQAVSERISQILDRDDPIPQAYFLEVSSPGVERILQKEKDFLRFYGSLVNVHLFVPVEGKKQIKGKLGSVDKDNLELTTTEGKILSIPREKISQVRLAWDNKGGENKK